jgi:hypothetical protein
MPIATLDASSSNTPPGSDAPDRCGNVRTVQAILGHVSRLSTQIHLRGANLDQMSDAMSGRTYGQPA